MKNAYIPLFVCICLGLSACVTTKRKKSNDDISKVGKAFHNITSKYNRFFNSEVLMDETLASIEAGTENNYNELLHLYPSMQIDAKNYYETMDKIIEKNSTAIILHRVSDWTDDHYQMIGRAQFVKKDYESAEKTFRYILKYYDPEDMIKKDKKAVNKSKVGRNASRSSSVSQKERKKAEKERAADRKSKQKEREKEVKDRKKSAEQLRKEKIKSRQQAEKDRQKNARKKPVRRPKTAEEKPEAAETSKPSTKPESPKEEKPKKKELFEENPEIPKVEKEKSKSYFLKHRPIHAYSQLWLARTLIERDRYWEAEGLLNDLADKKTYFPQFEKDLAAANGYLYLVMEQPEKASQYLAQASDLSNDRLEKARIAFITAQLYEEQKDFEQAEGYYRDVVKLHPNYPMEINALLGQRKMQLFKGKSSTDNYIKSLERLAKEEKNIPYQDQIYFDIALVHFENGNTDEGIRNLQLAAANSNNKFQKTEIYFRIAEYFYDQKVYNEAKYYYDTTLVSMAEEDERYIRVENLANNLTIIAEQIEIIEYQDSLLALSALDEKSLRKLAQKMKKEQQRKETLAALESQDQNSAKSGLQASRFNQLNALRNNTGGATNDVGPYFAYDEKSLKKGIKAFEKTWGNIELGDNWKYGNTGLSFASGDEANADTLSGEDISATELDEMFSEVPSTEEEKQAILEKIRVAQFVLGKEYKSAIDDNISSIETLEDLIAKFPETEDKLEAYYVLYLDYRAIANSGKAKYYSDLIQNEYPESAFAAAINSNFSGESQSDEITLEQYYQTVFSQYNEGSFQNAIAQIDASLETYGTKHDFLAKFALLRALCVGELHGRDAYVESLKEVIAKYPGTAEEKKAKDIIRLLGIQFTETSQGIQEINVDDFFSVAEKDKLHFALISSREEVKRMNDIRVAISKFNTKYFKLDRIKESAIVLQKDDSKMLFVIRKFNSRDDVMNYYNTLVDKLDEFIEIDNMEFFVVTQPNYRKIIQIQSLDLYRPFFIQEYLK